MKKLRWLALFAALVFVLAGLQEPVHSVVAAQTDALVESVKVYNAGQDVISPTLMAQQEPFPDIGKCHHKLDGKVKLFLIVDSSGRPRNIFFDQPLGTDLDKLALRVLEFDRFTPGTLHGLPVAVSRSAEMHLQGCVEETKAGGEKIVKTLKLRYEPEQKFSGSPQSQDEVKLTPIAAASGTSDHIHLPSPGVTEPKLLIAREAKFSDYARKNKIQGTSVLGMEVDAHGLPQNIRVTEALGAGLDEKAIEAVSGYRFRPAMQNGMPVPVKISVEVRFRLY
jgi:TonB family protein